MKVKRLVRNPPPGDVDPLLQLPIQGGGATGSYSDLLDRQLQERVNITNFQGSILMNRRNEMGGVRVERTRYRRWGNNLTAIKAQRRSPLLDAILQASRGVEGGLYQDGGAWGRVEEEDFGQAFLLSYKHLPKCPCALWIGSQ